TDTPCRNRAPSSAALAHCAGASAPPPAGCALSPPGPRPRPYTPHSTSAPAPDKPPLRPAPGPLRATQETPSPAWRTSKDSAPPEPPAQCLLPPSAPPAAPDRAGLRPRQTSAPASRAKC